MHQNVIVLTGGHAGTTAIAVAEQLRLKDVNDDLSIYWIGPKSSVEGKKLIPIEQEILPKLGVNVEAITSGRLQRKLTLWTVPSLFKIPLGFFEALLLLNKLKPKVILCFGGSVGVVVVIAGWVLGIKIIVHEQTVAVGRANLLAAKFAAKIAISRSDSKKYFPSEKTILSGNPLMRNVMGAREKQELSSVPTLLITLGSRGSQRVNKVISEALEKLLQHYNLIHITGELDYQTFLKIKEKLHKSIRSRYHVKKTINPLEIGNAYEKSDIALARSGANTVYELVAKKVPTIFIPLPFTYLNEQFLNAKYAVDFGIGTIIEEKNLNKETLIEGVEYVRDHWRAIKANTAKKKSPDLGASEKIADLLIKAIS